MAKVCQVTGRRPVRGNSVVYRGIAKKKKGIGLNKTGITSRRFLPNLMKKRFFFPEENRFITLKLSARAIRTIDKKGLSTIVRQLRAEGQKI